MDKITAYIGGGGFLATITAEQLNTKLACAIAAVTLIALVPLAVNRWSDFFAKSPKLAKASGAGVVLIILAIASLFFSGCSSLVTQFKAVKAPSLTVTPSPAGPIVKQTGNAATPARVVTTESNTTVPLQPGITITISTDGAAGQRVATPSSGGSAPSVVFSSHSTSVETPTAFTPPAPPPPPTPRELANAEAIRNSYFFAAGLAVLAGLLLWRGHGKAALIAAVSAIACPLLTNFVGSAWGQGVALAGVCIAGALFAAWHFLRDKFPAIANLAHTPTATP